MVGVHPRRPVQRKPGTLTPFSAVRYGWGAPTAPRPTQAWNSDPQSLVWSDQHETKKKWTKKGDRGTQVPGAFFRSYVCIAYWIEVNRNKPLSPAPGVLSYYICVCHYCTPKAFQDRLVLHLQWTWMTVTKVCACEEPFLLIAEIVYKNLYVIYLVPAKSSEWREPDLEMLLLGGEEEEKNMSRAFL